MSDLQQNGMWTLVAAGLMALNARFLLPFWVRSGLLIPRRAITPDTERGVQKVGYIVAGMLVAMGMWNLLTG